jgi:hypothetical protein
MLKLLTVCATVGLAWGAIAAASAWQGPQPPAQQTTPQYSADLKVGDMAPDFSLPGSDGKTHKLSDYRGKTVVIAWFPKAFTGG